MKHTVLIIDDMPFNIRLIKEILEDEGYQVDTICEEINEEIIDLIDQKKPSVILLDIMMPGISGFVICQKIKEDKRLYEIPIIMLSAISDRESVLRAYEAGAHDFVSKPFEDHQLLLSIQSAVEKQYKPSTSVIQSQGKAQADSFDAYFLFNKLHNDSAFFLETVFLFEDNASKLLENINKHIALHDYESFKQDCHALKNLLVYFNAHKAFDILERIENTFGIGDTANTLPSALDKELKHIVNAARQFIKETPGIEDFE